MLLSPIKMNLPTFSCHLYDSSMLVVGSPQAQNVFAMHGEFLTDKIFNKQKLRKGEGK